MRWLILVAAAAWALALAAGAGAGSQAFKPRKCGPITVRKGGNDYTYGIKVFQAPLACSTVDGSPRTGSRSLSYRSASPRPASSTTASTSRIAASGRPLVSPRASI